MKSFLLFLVGLSLMAGACSRKSQLVNDANTEISFSSVCGWCTGGDSLKITPSSSTYLSYKSCDISSAEKTERSTSETDWKELMALLDMEKFTAIDLNICNVCSDGCDSRVTVKKGKINHSISYGSLDNAAVSEIRPFLEKVKAIRDTYKNND